MTDEPQVQGKYDSKNDEYKHQGLVSVLALSSTMGARVEQ